MTRSDTLREPRRIAIIGGGPAGALSALLLRRCAVLAGRDIEVVIFERKEFGVTGPRSCNMCAGIVSNSLVRNLEAIGVQIPQTVMQREIEAYRLVAPGAQVRLTKPAGSRIYSAFRSGGPMGETLGAGRSFDQFLLQAAVAAGGRLIGRVVKDVRLPRDRFSPAVVEDAEGDEHEADAVIGAFGVNSRMIAQFERLGFGYHAPRTAMAAQCEIGLPTEEIDARFGHEVKVLLVGMRGVSLAAMIPKERHVTVSLIGRQVGQADLERFLQLPAVRALFPADWEIPDQYCHCHPRLPVTAARNAVADRILVVGDAHVSRYLKNGLDSAFVTASLAAAAIMEGGVDRDSLVRLYAEPCRRLFVRDNFCGRILFGAHYLLTRAPGMAAAHLSVVLREQATPGPKTLNSILWGMVTGDETYSVLLRRALTLSLRWRLLGGAVRALWGCRPSVRRLASRDEGSCAASGED